MHFLSPVDTSLGRSSLFGLALTRAALIGVVGEAASLSIYFLPFLWSGRNIPIGFFWFYKVYSKHLGILSKKLRTQLRSWGFYFFWRRLLSCRKNFWFCFQRFTKRGSRDVGGLVCPLQYFWGLCALVFGVSDHHTLVWQCFLWDLCTLFSPLSRGFSKTLGRTATHLQNIYQEVYTFTSVSLVSRRIKCWWDVSLLSDRICFSSIY